MNLYVAVPIEILFNLQLSGGIVPKVDIRFLIKLTGALLQEGLKHFFLLNKSGSLL